MKSIFFLKKKNFKLDKLFPSTKIEDNLLINDIDTMNICIPYSDNFIDIVNEVQSINPQNKKEIYTIYREYIPKNNKWNKYIKSNTKEPNKELVEVLTKYFSCSKKETKEYIYLLDKQDISRILTSIGLDKKEITKLI